MLKAEGVKGDFLEYKGRPLVRQDDNIYYGDLSDNYYTYLMVISEKSAKNGEDIPDQIMVQLFKSGENKPEKQTFSKGLYDALEMASAWLDRYNK